MLRMPLPPFLVCLALLLLPGDADGAKHEEGAAGGHPGGHGWDVWFRG